MVSTFESQLPLRVDMWRKVLIPYVASTFVRNKIFRDYYSKQFSEINEDKYFINNSTQYTRYKFYNEYKSIMYLYSLDILIDEKSRFILPDSGVAYLRASEMYIENTSSSLILGYTLKIKMDLIYAPLPIYCRSVLRLWLS